MHNTEPATSQDAARQGTAQQPDADRRAPAPGCAGPAWHLRDAHRPGDPGRWRQPVRPCPGRRPGARARHALGRALTSPPTTLAGHAALGTLLLVAAVNVLTRAIQARHKLAIAASATGLAAIAGAAARGASFISDSIGASMAMAVLTGVALLCYLGNLFVVHPRPTAAGQDDQ